MTRSIPEMSLETRMIRDRLKAAAVGDTVTYAELSEIIGEDITNGARSHLQSARNSLLADSIVFGTVHKVGVKRLKDTEIVGVGEAVLPGIRRRARKAIKQMTCVRDFGAMPRESQMRHNTLVSALGAVAHFAKDSSVERLGKAVEAANTALPIGRTLDAFRK